MRLLLYTGKGGVGKTTTAAATAAVAARRGARTLVISADAAHSLGDVLDRPLDGTGAGGRSERGEPIRIAPGLDALEVDPRIVIERHWGQVRSYAVDLLRHQGIDEVLAEELALLPGADELAALVTMENWASSGRYDLIVVDCAPTGSTLRLVSLPEVTHGGLRWLLKLQRAAAWVAEPIVSGLVGAPMPKAEVFGEAERLLYGTLTGLHERLVHVQTHVRLVVTPETMVIDEALRALTDLALYGLRADAVVMNRIWPEAALAENFFRGHAQIQAEQIDRVAGLFEPMALLEAPLQADEVLGYEAILAHGESLFARHDPLGVLGERPGLRFSREGERGMLRLPIVARDPGGIEVARIEDELMIGVDGRRRRIALPTGLRRLEVERVAVEAEELLVAFGPGPAGNESCQPVGSVGARGPG
jgi:arsenite-transporting ATPase